jgi:hypothetical protein
MIKILRNQVENAVSLINTIYNRQVAGELTEEEAKKLAADLIREIRYGDNGYFWIDTYEGVNVVLLGNETEGTNRYNTKDSNGYEMIKAIIANGSRKAAVTRLLVSPRQERRYHCQEELQPGIELINGLWVQVIIQIISTKKLSWRKRSKRICWQRISQCIRSSF